mmetsp:Transcript_27943/g.66014  ORF Transcript_27943/g.66014 Transcript_27943/m.66014 type:complete len:260 (-) Transcript_27943:223-1002(-)
MAAPMPVPVPGARAAPVKPPQTRITRSASLPNPPSHMSRAGWRNRFVASVLRAPGATPSPVRSKPKAVPSPSDAPDGTGIAVGAGSRPHLAKNPTVSGASSVSMLSTSGSPEAPDGGLAFPPRPPLPPGLPTASGGAGLTPPFEFEGAAREGAGRALRHSQSGPAAGSDYEEEDEFEMLDDEDDVFGFGSVGSGGALVLGSGEGSTERVHSHPMVTVGGRRFDSGDGRRSTFVPPHQLVDRGCFSLGMAHDLHHKPQEM